MPSFPRWFISLFKYLTLYLNVEFVEFWIITRKVKIYNLTLGHIQVSLRNFIVIKLCPILPQVSWKRSILAVFFFTKSSAKIDLERGSLWFKDLIWSPPNQRVKCLKLWNLFFLKHPERHIRYNYDCLKNIRLPNNKCTLLPLFGPSTALLSRIFSLEFNKTQVPSSPTILQFVWHSPPHPNWIVLQR